MRPSEPQMTDSGIHIKDWDQPIYRVFPKHRFMELLDTKKNALVQPKLWDDPMENFFLRSKVIMKNGEYANLDNIESSWYGQCWTTKPESDAMWRIYSPKKNGIKVKTTIRKLFSTIYNNNDKFRKLKYFVGKVSYKSREEIENFLKSVSFTDMATGGEEYKLAKTLLVKRPEFDHEEEVRILYQDAEEDYQGDKCVFFDLDPNKVFEEVVIDPRVGENEYKSTQKQIANKGCTVRIYQSDLYQISQSIVRM